MSLRPSRLLCLVPNPGNWNDDDDEDDDDAAAVEALGTAAGAETVDCASGRDGSEDVAAVLACCPWPGVTVR